MKQGDFIRIDFVGRIVGTGQIFDLTDADVAKKEGVYNERISYGPALVIIGANMVIPGVERHLQQMNVGDQLEFEVEPLEAFGPRDLRKIRIVSFSNFMTARISPIPGDFVTIDGREAKIQSVSGGRVRVDFNHPLAGKKLHYTIKILSQITDTMEKANAVIGYYNIKADAGLSEGRLQVTTEKNLQAVIQKLIESTVKRWIAEIKEVQFISREKPPESGKKESNINLSAEKPAGQDMTQKA